MHTICKRCAMLVRFANTNWVPVRNPLSRALSSSSKTYYDSQSGGYITVGGGRQLHDTTFSCSSQALDRQLLQKVLDSKPASLEVGASLLESISKHATRLPSLYIKIQQDSEFDSLSQKLRSAFGGYVRT